MNTGVYKSCLAIPVIALLSLMAIGAAAQNKLPVLRHVTAVADTIQHTVTIRYSLFDEDNDSLAISCMIIDKHGRQVNTAAEMSGDIGFPVVKGAGRLVAWKYSTISGKISDHTIRLIADDRHLIDIHDLVLQVDTVNLQKDLRSIYGIRDMNSAKGKAHLQEVRKLITKRIQANGLSLYKQPVTAGTATGYNIWGDLRGLRNDSVTYILAAHYDAVHGSPAADDNGSGVAGLLKAIDVLSKYQFAHTIRFIAFDMEENGCVGSRTYINERRNPAERIEGMINLDMIGFYSDSAGSQLIPEGFDLLFPDACKKIVEGGAKGNFAVNIANDSSGHLSSSFEKNVASYVPSLKVVTLITPDNGKLTPTMRSGDHGSFWNAGYKAIFLGDGGETRDIYLDSPKDIIANINYSFLANNVKATIATLATWAGIQHVAISRINISVK